MARKRTGNLIMRPSGAFARVWVKGPDGTERRQFISLETKDRTTAKRKLARLLARIAAGEVVAEAVSKAVHAAETYRAYSTALHERRMGRVSTASDEQNNRVRYIYDTIGDLPLARVTDDHVRQVLEGAVEVGLAWETVRKIRAVMSRDFKRARIEKLITVSPVQDVELPAGLKRDKRPRVILTDEEIGTLLAHPKASLEIKMLSLVARTEGGMRTSELLRWDWTMLDLVDFAACTIARSKTGDIQRLEVPEVLRAFLRGWWERAGRPAAGAVFPVRRGPRVGAERKPGASSFAHALRRELFKAGVYRVPPIQVPATSAGTRTDLKKTAKGTKPAPSPTDPLYFDTTVSRRVDFHSFRRAYNTALARAGVNIQQAMNLASHSDAKVHMGYVNAVEATKPVPAAALPAIDASLAGRLMSGDRAGRWSGVRALTGANSSSRTAVCAENPAIPVRDVGVAFASSCAPLGSLLACLLSRRSPVRVGPGAPRDTASCGEVEGAPSEGSGTAGANWRSPEVRAFRALSWLWLRRAS